MPHTTRMFLGVVAVAAGLLTGCGGKATVVTVTQHTTPTAPLTTTAPPVTTTATSTAPPLTSTTGVGDVPLELRLPAENVIPSLRSGTVEQKPTAADMVATLYAAGDAAIPQATARLEAAGYVTGVLRDQRGGNPRRGLTLLRVYIYRVRDAATAQREVTTAVDEVRASSSAASEDVTVPDVPGARGLLLHPTAGGVAADVLYVTWASGADVYGIQAFARQDATLFKDQILELAASLHRAWNDTP